MKKQLMALVKWVVVIPIIVTGIALGVIAIGQSIYLDCTLTPEQKIERAVQSNAQDLMGASSGNLIETPDMAVWVIVTVNSNMITVMNQNTTMTQDATVLARSLNPRHIVDARADRERIFNYLAVRFVEQCVEHARTNQMASNK